MRRLQRSSRDASGVDLTCGMDPTHSFYIKRRSNLSALTEQSLILARGVVGVREDELLGFDMALRTRFTTSRRFESPSLAWL